MKHIFKYILIFTTLTLFISSCQEEMEAPGGGETVVPGDGILSASQQFAAVKSTAAELDNYYEELEEDFLPEFIARIEGLDTSADEVGSVTEAMNSILGGMGAAQNELKTQIGTVKEFISANANTTDQCEMTQASMRLHMQLSAALALVPARIEAIMVLLEIFSAEDKENVKPVYDELADLYDALQVRCLSKVITSLNSWLGKEILPDYYGANRQRGLARMLQNEMDERYMPFRTALQAVLDALDAPQDEALSEEEFEEIILTAISENKGRLNAEAGSRISGNNRNRKGSVSNVNAAFVQFKSSVVQAVSYIAPVQSLVFMSSYAENVADAKYSTYGREDIVLSFTINPQEVASVLVEDWESYMTLQAYDPAQGLSATPPTIKNVTIEENILTVVVDPANVPQTVYGGTSDLDLLLDVSNGFKVIATEDLIRLRGKSMPGLNFPNGYENLEVLKGESVSILFKYSAGDDAQITVEANDKISGAYLNQSSDHKELKMGYVAASINELNDVSTQKVTVTLTSGGETVSKVITFREIGYFDVSCSSLVSADGGEVNLTPSTNLTFSKDVQAQVTGGAAWTTKVETYRYSLSANESTNPRTSVVSFTITINGKEHHKSVQITQLGTNANATNYSMFLGTWKLTAKDKISGASVDLYPDFKQDPGVTDGYLVYGLSSASGNTPVRMKYSNATGNVQLTVPQVGLSGSTGLYRASLSGNVPSMNNESTTFLFTWNGSTLSGNMTQSDSFMYMDADGSVAGGDNIFLYNVSLTRASTPVYEDGRKVTLYEGDAGKTYPLNIIILGDGYQTKDLQEGGKFFRSARSAMNTIFAYEPYKSFQNRFDVHIIPYASNDEGTDILDQNIYKDTRYSSVCRSNSTLVTCDYSKVMADVAAAGFSDNDLYKSLVILLINADTQSGTCWQSAKGTTSSPAVSGDGYMSNSIAMIPANNAFATSGLIIHEAGGHGFGRLADEYTSTSGNTFDGHVGLQNSHNQGFYWNVSPYQATDSRCPWYKFYQIEAYRNAGVGSFESAYLYQYGIYRSENTSIMINNTGKFNAISRWMIYRRIRMQSEGGGNEDTIFNDFITYDTINL